MRKRIHGFIALMLLGADAYAKPQCEVALEIVSSYVDVNSVVLVDDAAYQPYVACTTESGVTGIVWATHSEGRWWGPTSEINVLLERVWSFGTFDGAVGFLGFFVPGITDIGSFYGEVGRSFQGGVRLYARAEHYALFTDGFPREGELFRLGASYDRALRERVTWSSDVHVYHDTGAFGFDQGQLGTLQTGISFSLTELLTLQVSAQYHEPFAVDDSRKGRLVGSILVSRSF